MNDDVLYEVASWLPSYDRAICCRVSKRWLKMMQACTMKASYRYSKDILIACDIHYYILTKCSFVSLYCAAQSNDPYTLLMMKIMIYRGSRDWAYGGLEGACLGGNHLALDFIEHLIKEHKKGGADYDRGLRAACIGGHLSIFRQLIQHITWTSDRYMFLMEAIVGKNKEIIEICKKEADDQQYANTLIDAGYYSGDREMIKQGYELGGLSNRNKTYWIIKGNQIAMIDDILEDINKYSISYAYNIKSIDMIYKIRQAAVPFITPNHLYYIYRDCDLLDFHEIMKINYDHEVDDYDRYYMHISTAAYLLGNVDLCKYMLQICNNCSRCCYISTDDNYISLNPIKDDLKKIIDDYLRLRLA